MSDRTQDLKNLRAVATACKNYVDETKEQILWQVGQYNITTQDDNTTAYQKIVPTGATRAKIKSIGFMSYKSENLLNIADKEETTTNGITYKIENGVITLNGTATSNFGLNINLGLSINGNYVLAIFNNTTLNVGNVRLYHSNSGGNVIVASAVAFDTTNNYKAFTTSAYSGAGIGISIPNETTLTNLIIKPMLVKGSTAPTEYKQGFENIRDSIVTSVKSYGANLFDDNGTDSIQYVGHYYTNTGAYNYSLASNTNFNCFRVSVKENTTYYIKQVGNLVLRYEDSSNNVIGGTDSLYSNGYGSFTTPSGCAYVVFSKGVSSILQTMLNYGSTAIPYKPYRGLIDTITIPSEIQALDGYGRGINENCYNILDLNTKEFTDKDNTLDIGALTYTKSASGLFQGMPPSDIKHPSANTQIPNLLSTIYTPIASRDIYGPQSATPSPNGVMALAVLDYLFFNNTDYTDTSEFKTAMNGVNLQYELATYNTTDNLELPDNVIEVEEGGYLVFENQYQQAVPSNITYRIEVAS